MELLFPECGRCVYADRRLWIHRRCSVLPIVYGVAVGVIVGQGVADGCDVGIGVAVGDGNSVAAGIGVTYGGYGTGVARTVNGQNGKSGLDAGST